MQMVRLNVTKRRDTERKKDDKVDLDEKIRRIREANKARERRFKEIEDDKMQALSDGTTVGDTRYYEKESGLMKQNFSIIKEQNKAIEKRSDEIEHYKLQAPNNATHTTSIKCNQQESSIENEQGKTAMKGILATNRKKLTKGRGQRLLEMSQEPLQARQFELQARENNGLEEKSHSIKSKLGNNIGLEKPYRSKPGNMKYFINQRNIHGKEEVLSHSNIPSSGYNPLMDDTYRSNPKESNRTDKPDPNYLLGPERKHGSFGEWKEMDKNMKGAKTEQRGEWDRFNGQRDVKVGQEKTVEDWSTEFISMNKSEVGPTKVEPNITEEKPAVDEPLKEQIQDGECICDKAMDRVGLSEDNAIDNNKNKKLEHDEHNINRGVDEIPKVCQRLGDLLPTFLHDDSHADAKVHEDCGIEEENELAVGCRAEETSPIVPEQQDELKEQKQEDTVFEINSKRQDKPKITINTKLKKTASTSSFDENMSMLSPLDVPTNWGDCDFSDDNFEPIF